MIRRNLPFILICCGIWFFLFNIGYSWTHKDKAPPNTLKVKIDTYHEFVVITSSQSKKHFHKNLLSIFEQEYPYFRVIYIDSPEQGKKFLEEWVEREGFSRKVECIDNCEKKSELENLYQAIHSCKDEEILVFLEEDQWFAHHLVLDQLNTYYQDPKVWMTYGNNLEYPLYKRSKDRKIHSEVHKKHTYRFCREFDFIVPPLHTGYGALFKKIHLKDLTQEGRFFSSYAERALQLPAIEMAKEHAHFISEVLCIRASKKEDKKEKKTKEYIHHLPSYQPLVSWRE